LQDGQRPRRPFFEPLRAGVVLVLETEKDEMPGVARRESRNLEVVMNEPVRRGGRVVAAREELLLVVVPGAPGEDRADVEAFAAHLAAHVGRIHSNRRVLVMTAAGGVDVVIGGVPPEGGRIDPAAKG